MCCERDFLAIIRHDQSVIVDWSVGSAAAGAFNAYVLKHRERGRAGDVGDGTKRQTAELHDYR